MPDVFGLIFLRYLNLRFEARYAELLAEDPQQAESAGSYSTANAPWLPQLARWSRLRATAERPHIGAWINKAMATVERVSPSLKGVLPKKYVYDIHADEELGTLIELISSITSDMESATAQVVLRELCEFLLDDFAKPLTWRDPLFNTPSVINRILVEMLIPRMGSLDDGVVSVYDPCCGVGDTLLQATQRFARLGADSNSVSVYGQEIDRSFWHLCRLHLEMYDVVSQGIAHQGNGTLHRDAWEGRQFDYVMAHPPTYMPDWGVAKLSDDPRWKFGIPPPKSADYAWLQHALHHLAPNGSAGVVLDDFSTTAATAQEQTIRQNLIENGLVDCVVALPGQLFRTSQSAAAVWILTRGRCASRYHDRRREVLFINAQALGETCRLYPVQRALSESDIGKITGAYHSWRGDEGAVSYTDDQSLCRSVSIDEIRQRNYSLVPESYAGRYAEEEDYCTKRPRSGGRGKKWQERGLALVYCRVETNRTWRIPMPAHDPLCADDSSFQRTVPPHGRVALSGWNGSVSAGRLQVNPCTHLDYRAESGRHVVHVRPLLAFAIATVPRNEV